MASGKSKGDIADFFRLYARSQPPKSIPAKRPSPTDDRDSSIWSGDKQQEWIEPRTPPVRSRGRDALSSATKTPRSGTSVNIPIRSPKPPYSQASSNYSALRKGDRCSSVDERDGREQKPLFFADVPSTGQSILKDGKIIAVKSSDDEDSDSLCSLDEILGRNRFTANTDSSSPPSVEILDSEAQRAKILSIFTNGRSKALIGRDKLRELTSKANGLDNLDINLLVDEYFDDKEIEANVTKAKRGYQTSDEQERLRRQAMIDKNLLVSMVGQGKDQGDLQRLLNAVERTEALATEHVWSMFDLISPSAISRQPLAFPEGPLESNSWTDCLRDPSVRNRAYLSGHVSQKAIEGAIPDDIITWTLLHIIFETREDLRHACLQVVKAASQTWTSRSLTPILIEEIFCLLGADPTIVECATEIRPEPRMAPPHNAPIKEPLLAMIEALSSVSIDMNPEAVSKFTKLLMRLALDSHLMAHSRIVVVVEGAISHLLSHSSEHVAECILNDIGFLVKDPSIQTHALLHILPTSPAAAALRIRLAQIFLLGVKMDSPAKSDIMTTNLDLEQLTDQLAKIQRKILSPARKDTSQDYSALTSLIYIFDAALANGGDRPRRPPQLPTPPDNNTITSNNNTNNSEPDDALFDRRVDTLADQVKSIITSIVDAGASHMRRTEAKEALNALHSRLQYGVRTKPRPKKSVFGSRIGDGAGVGVGHAAEEEKSVAMMQRFLDGRRR